MISKPLQPSLKLLIASRVACLENRTFFENIFQKPSTKFGLVLVDNLHVLGSISLEVNNGRYDDDDNRESVTDQVIILPSGIGIVSTIRYREEMITFQRCPCEHT